MRILPALLLFLLVAPAFSSEAGESPRAYWIPADTRERISPAEQAELEVQHVDTLFCEIGELMMRAGIWRWEYGPMRLPAARQQRVAVVRLRVNCAEYPNPFRDAALITAKLQTALGNAASGPLVIDFDCPPSLLPDYAGFLVRLRAAFPQLAATASADWISQPAFLELQQAVNELEVRFYDPKPQPTLPDASTPPPPLVDEGGLEKSVAAWARSPIRWRPIVPNFATAHIYDASGKFRQSISTWDWDQLLHAPGFASRAPASKGGLICRTERPMRIASAEFRAGESLWITMPDRDALAHELAKATAAGSAGGIMFLPNANPESGWSLRQLRNLEEQKAQFVVRAQGNRLVLTNASGADLAPVCGEANTCGYILELGEAGQAWASASRGDFLKITGFKDSKEREKRFSLTFNNPGVRGSVEIVQAQRLQLAFSTLRAGESLTTGPIRFRPGLDLKELRYRIAPIETEWKPLQTAEAAPETGN